MAKYVIDVNFDIPQEVLSTLHQDSAEAVKVLKCSEEIMRFDPSENIADEYSSIRVSLRGSDAAVDRTGRKLKLHIGDRVFASKGYDIVHCQS